jgi:hypothetical protein
MYLPQGRHIVVIFNLDFEFLTLQKACTWSEVTNNKNQNAENYQFQYPCKENMLGEIFEETNSEYFFSLLESL